MATFYLKLQVAPVPGGKQATLVAGAHAHCWIVASSAAAALNKARWKGVCDRMWPISRAGRDELIQQLQSGAVLEEERKAPIAITIVMNARQAWARDPRFPCS